MSIWTHVAAVIRFDGLQLFGDTPPELGNGCAYHDPKEKWDRCDIPTGSEGSLQTHLWVNPEKNNLAAYTATIWGDLRDYTDVKEVIDYLKRITKDKMVRNGVATIEVEGEQAVILHYINNEWELTT